MSKTSQKSPLIPGWIWVGGIAVLVVWLLSKLRLGASGAVGSGYGIGRKNMMRRTGTALIRVTKDGYTSGGGFSYKTVEEIISHTKSFAAVEVTVTGDAVLGAAEALISALQKEPLKLSVKGL